MLIWFCFIACVHTGFRFPGPTRTMGRAPVPYQVRVADKVERQMERMDGRHTADAGVGKVVASRATDMMGRSRLVVDGESFRYDCSGLVEAVYAAAGVSLRGSVKMMFEQAKSKGVVHRKKIPRKGDLAFFDNSYDRNKNGRRDDDLTHVGIVENVLHDGTVVMIHLGSKGVVRNRMNLRNPNVHASPANEIWNSFLRVPTRRDNGPRLTGSLWRAFGSLWDTPLDSSRGS